MLDKIFELTEHLEDLFTIEFKNVQTCNSCSHKTENITRGNPWVIHLQVIIKESKYLYIVILTFPKGYI